METEIINKFENKSLDREEYEINIKFDGATPKRMQVRDKVSALVNSKPNLTIVKKIFTRAGSRQAFAKVYVYKTQETLTKVEPKYLIERNAKKEVSKGKDNQEAKDETKAPKTEKPETKESKPEEKKEVKEQKVEKKEDKPEEKKDEKVEKKKEEIPEVKKDDKPSEKTDDKKNDEKPVDKKETDKNKIE